MDSLISNSNINPADYKTLFPLFIFDVLDCTWYRDQLLETLSNSVIALKTGRAHPEVRYSIVLSPSTGIESFAIIVRRIRFIG